MAFDPSQFGATLATPSSSGSGGFNASQFGATAVDQNTISPQNTQNAQKQGFGGMVGSFGKALLAPVVQGAKNVGTVAKNVGSDVVSGVKQAGSDLAAAGKASAAGATVKVPANSPDAQRGFSMKISPQLKADPTAVASDMMQAGGDVAKAAMAPINDSVAKPVQDISSALSDNPSFQKVASSKVGAALATANIPGDKYTAWAAAHPEASKDLEALGNVAGAASMAGAGPEAAETVAGKAGDALDATADAAKGAVNKVSSTVSDAADARAASKSVAADKAATDSTWKMVQPDLSKSEVIEGAKTGDVVEAGKTGKLTQVAQDRNADMVEAAKPFVANAKTPIEAIGNMQKGIADEAAKLRTGLENSNAIWNKNTLKGALNKLDKPDLITADPVLNRAYDLVTQRVMKAADGAPKSLDGLLDVRQELDAQVKRQFSNLYNSDTMTPMRTAVKQIRSAINDQIESQLPEGKTADGTGFKDSLKKQSLLYDAVDNTAAKVGKIGDATKGIGHTVTKFAKAHPITTRVAKGIAIGAGIGTGGALGAEVLKGF